jgi:hypothetical protein
VSDFCVHFLERARKLAFQQVRSFAGAIGVIIITIASNEFSVVSVVLDFR